MLEQTIEMMVENWGKVLELLVEETEAKDRDLAIVAPAFLDMQLKQLITGFLIDDEAHVNDLLHEKGIKPLGSFGARIEAAYCLGLISEDEYHDLDIIREIRNDFAHELDLSFTDQSIADRCNNLKLPKKPYAYDLLSGPNKPRNYFQVAAFLLGILLPLRISEVEKNRERRVVPSEIQLKPTLDMLFSVINE